MDFFDELPTLPMPKVEPSLDERSLPCTLKGLSDWAPTWDGLLPPYRYLLKGIIEGEWQEIANKILAGHKLTKMQKKATYFLLTGEVPPSVKKGRPSKADEHYNLALDYITARSDGLRGSGLKRLREELVKKYCKTDNFRENTFYAAFKRGREEIREFANLIINRGRELGTLDDGVQEAIETAKQWILEMDNYNNQGGQLQKTRK